MARTGARAARLKKLLTEAGLEPTASKKPLWPLAFDTGQQRQLLRLYRALGGQLEAPQFAPGAWDLVFADGLHVELDEQLHFNRYRAATLDSPWTSELAWTPAYKAYCTSEEARCLKDGRSQKRWTSPPAERMFGVSGPPGDLEILGSARWRQRALYDCMKDTLAASGSVHLARVSIFDEVDGTALEKVLTGRADVSPAALRSLTLERAQLHG
ncbi:hypothetical protein ACFQ58_08690 [Agromyces sp. NPDC056523]|uniref:DUF7255 family protein n=1 Tax=Agromyces sp. NPDC056523 TaxID=3345850 RepID=UPI00366C3C7A